MCWDDVPKSSKNLDYFSNKNTGWPLLIKTLSFEVILKLKEELQNKTYFTAVGILFILFDQFHANEISTLLWSYPVH